MYDIIIIGAGPAGANLARLTGDRYRVLLIDKRNLEHEEKRPGRNKCCGGLLAPDAQQMIARLGLGMPKDILVDPQLFAVRTIDLTSHLERLYQRFYYNMDREKFDQWLVSLVPLGVDRRFDAVFSRFTEIPEGYEVSYFQDGQERSAKTRMIVGADGAFSKIRKSIGSGVDSPDLYIAIQEWFECASPMPYFTAVFDAEVTDFYAWVIPKDDALLLGAALKPGEDPREKYALLKEKLVQSGFRFGDRIRTEGAYLNRPKKNAQFFAGKNGIALVGEAAGAISPSSAEGISYALKTSLYLAQSLEDGIEGFLARYEGKVKAIRRNLFLKNLKSPAMYHPVLRRMAMGSGLQGIR